MPKPPKVVPITADEQRLIAMDQKAHRLIVGIGSQRFAIDFFTRVTTLPPRTGDQPATVLPMKKKGGKSRRDQIAETMKQDIRRSC